MTNNSFKLFFFITLILGALGGYVYSGIGGAFAGILVVVFFFMCACCLILRNARVIGILAIPVILFVFIVSPIVVFMFDEQTGKTMMKTMNDWLIWLESMKKYSYHALFGAGAFLVLAMTVCYVLGMIFDE